MKEIRKVLLVYSLVAFVLALLVNMAVDSLLGTPPDWLETLLEAALYGLLAGAGLSWLTYSFLKPRLSFLTSGEREVPAFGGREARVIPVTAANFSFEVIKYRIREQRYIITYYDDVEQYIVKFRSRFGESNSSVKSIFRAEKVLNQPIETRFLRNAGVCVGMAEIDRFTDESSFETSSQGVEGAQYSPDGFFIYSLNPKPMRMIAPRCDQK